MARPKSLKPKHRHHKATGRGFVVLSGDWKYTGKWGTQAANDEYDRLIGEWIAGGRQGLTKPPGAADKPGEVVTVNVVLAAFLLHAQEFYRKADGTPTNEVENFKSVIRPLRRLYGNEPAAEFGPLSLVALQGEMVRLDWCRNFINKQTARIKHIFRWAVSRQIIPPAIHQALDTVPGLKKGKTKAREKAEIKPVPEADVEAVIPEVSRQVAAMIRLQQYTGMRPGEVCMMRWCDIDKSGKVWEYTPQEHKTEHHGHTRIIFIGPKAQAELNKWTRPDLSAYIFQPTEAEATRLAALHEERIKDGTPLSYGNRPGTNRVRKPKRKPGECYDVGAYRKAIIRACERAFGMPEELLREEPRPEQQAPAQEWEAWTKTRRARLDKATAWRRQHCWHPHQLRHNAATYLRRKFGLDAAKVILGHATLTATQVYAEQDRTKARDIMGKVG